MVLIKLSTLHTRQKPRTPASNDDLCGRPRFEVCHLFRVLNSEATLPSRTEPGASLVYMVSKSGETPVLSFLYKSWAREKRSICTECIAWSENTVRPRRRLDGGLWALLLLALQGEGRDAAVEGEAVFPLHAERAPAVERRVRFIP